MKSLRAIASRSRSEDGALLLTTVVISLVVFTTILIMASTNVVLVNKDRSVKSTIQAQQAARMGANVLTADLRKGTCVASGAVPVSKTSPTEWQRAMGFSWKTHRSTKVWGDLSDPPTSVDDPTVSAGCPRPTDKYVLLEITGFDGFAREKTLVYTYQWYPPTEPTIEYSRFRFALFSINLTLGGTIIPGGATLNANVGAGGNMNCSSGANLFGNLFILGSVESLLNCVIGGNVSAGSGVNVGASTGETLVGGRVCAQGSITGVSLATAIAGGTASYQPDCPGLNDTPAWVDYDPNLTEAANPGWDIVTQTSSSMCNTSSSSGALVTYLKNLTKPTIIDMRGCANGGTVNNNANFLFRTQIPMKTDATILGNRFNWSYVDIRSSDGNEHQFSLVTPDTVTSTPPKPDCVAPAQNSSVTQVKWAAPMKAMLYGPCSMGALAGGSSYDIWIRGQVYVGASLTFSPHILFIPVYLPGELKNYVFSGGGSGGYRLVAETELTG